MVKVIGGAQEGEFKAVASGTLPNGKPVVVNSDGTVTEVKILPDNIGSFTAADNDGDHTSAVFDSANNKVIIAYFKNNFGGYGVVGTVSGDSISFGTPVLFDADAVDNFSIAFDSTNNKAIISYRHRISSSSFKGYSIVGTVSGTSISFGSVAEFASFSSNTTLFSATAFDSNSGKFVVSYRDGSNSSYGTSKVGTISGTSISFGSATVFNSATSGYMSSTFDSSNNKVIVTYQNSGNSFRGTAKVGTVSGTSISFGSAVVFNTGNTQDMSSTFDSFNNKVVIAYRDNGNSDIGHAVVGTVSGTSISFGTAVQFDGSDSYSTAIAFDSNSNKVVVAWRDTTSADDYGKLVVGTVSGTSISFESSSFFSSESANHLAATFDSNSNKVVVASKVSGGFGLGALVFSLSATNLTSENYIGMSRGGISPDALGSPTVFEAADSGYIASAYDANTQKVVIVYQDNGNSRYGTAVVGTVSGNSISFGTPVVFNNSGQTDVIQVAYDTNAQKVVIFYRDYGNSYYGTAIVGTVSGTSISFGSPTVFESANTGIISVCYDANAQKVVVSYRDGGNSNYGTAIVGTVSGTSISFGSPTVFLTGEISTHSITYDTNAQKVVVAYRDNSNSSYGTAIVGTVSGTSISFGSSTVFESASIDWPSAVYEPNAQKIVITYNDGGNSNYGTAIVGTVSGTSISFGSAVVFESAGSYYNSAVYDALAKKVVIAFRGTSNYGRVVSGTVSGTSISFDSPFTFNSNTSNTTAAVYDINAERVAIAYQDNGNSSYGTGIVYKTSFAGEVADGGTASIDIIGSVSDIQSGLTAGQQYFVQTNGTIGLTADDPSVLAGTAISASKLLVKT